MIPVSYYAPDELTSPKFAYAFAKGCGGTITEETDLFPGPVALFGSPSRWPVLRQAQAEGRDFYYADHGYFGRKGFFRITKNAYQHDGRGEASPDRFRNFCRPIQPWRDTGSHVLVCPNSAAHFQVHGLSVTSWLDATTAALRTHTDREIRVRWKTQIRTRPLEQDLAGAWAVVVYSSSAAIDALIAGVPVFVLAPFCASARMGLSDLSRIEHPIYPDDRESFCAVLAAHQWTHGELFSGEAWRAFLTEAVPRAA